MEISPDDPRLVSSAPASDWRPELRRQSTRGERSSGSRTLDEGFERETEAGCRADEPVKGIKSTINSYF